MLHTSAFKVLAIALSASAGLVFGVPTNAVGNGTLAAPFGINLGNTNANDVAWIDGQSKCDNVIISSYGSTPCGRAFNLPNGQTGFTVNGCGAGNLWINQNGAFFSNCAPFSEADNCGVHTTWHCE